VGQHPYQLGIDLFNAGRFFDAHEALEDVWREAHGEEREFLQGIIQIAVGLHHHSTGNLVAARSLLARGADKLARFPDQYCDLRADRLRTAVGAWTQALANAHAPPPPPRLELAEADATLGSSVSHSSKPAVCPAVPMLDLQRQYKEIREEVFAAMERVCASQQFILGGEVEAFEHEVGQFLGATHAVACSSGTDALWLALTAAGVMPGDEVVTTPFSFFASASAIVRAGARPVFVDIDSRTLNLSVPLLERRLRQIRPARLAAILPVHLYGQCADMEAVESLARDLRVSVLEDAAQAFGASWAGRRAGTFGTAAAFSFYPTKNLSAYGDAGCVTTGDSDIADRIRSLRNHGSRTRYVHDELGGNCRMDALQAAILRVKLRHLEAWNELRRWHAALYDRLLREAGFGGSGSPLTLPETAPQARHIYHQYVVRASKRAELRSFLAARQIASEVYYPVPLHLQKPFAYLGYTAGDMPEADRAAGEVLALPMFPELTEDEQRTVVTAIAEFYS
jgi:dTDP-4-amino-4,6-dideoxygalactose transaminase